MTAGLWSLVRMNTYIHTYIRTYIHIHPPPVLTIKYLSINIVIDIYNMLYNIYSIYNCQYLRAGECDSAVRIQEALDSTSSTA